MTANIATQRRFIRVRTFSHRGTGEMQSDRKMYLASNCFAALVHTPQAFKPPVVMRLIHKINNDPVRRRATSSARPRETRRLKSYVG